jgi:hypothetical protein
MILQGFEVICHKTGDENGRTCQNWGTNFPNQKVGNEKIIMNVYNENNFCTGLSGLFV